MMKCEVIVTRDEEPEPQQVTIRSIKYRECTRNYAAESGGYVVDGCKEFRASGDEGTDAAMVCRKCGCHRNFHQSMEIIEAVCDSPTYATSHQTAARV